MRLLSQIALFAAGLVLAAFPARAQTFPAKRPITIIIGVPAGGGADTIARLIGHPEDVEDVLQDVFSELVESFQMMRPVEHIGPWLFRVARNRIIDLYRQRRPELSANALVDDEEGSEVEFQELLPSRDTGPDDALAREALIEELDALFAHRPDGDDAAEYALKEAE